MIDMSVCNNNLIFILFVILIINSVYGEPSGGHSGGSKIQTDLVLVGSCNKSSGFDGDNITIQYVLSNIGTKRNQLASDIVIPINIPSLFARPSERLQVSNDRQVRADHHNPYILLKTSKVEETSAYKLILDTNGCLTIDCPKLDPNNSIKISYLTHVDYSGDEDTNSIRSGIKKADFDNVRTYNDTKSIIVFCPIPRPIEVNTTNMFADGNKYYVLNNSEITIGYHPRDGKNKNVSYIYKTKDRKDFYELTSENRINRAGEFNFGIKLNGEAPRYNQSIFIVENLASYHNLPIAMVYLIIIFLFINLYSIIFKRNPKSHIIMRLIAVPGLLVILLYCIIFALKWIPRMYLSWPYYPNVILLQLCISLMSYIILLNLFKSSCDKISNIWPIIAISYSSFMLYLGLPIIICPPTTFSAFFSQIIGYSPAIIIIFIFIILLYYTYFKNRVPGSCSNESKTKYCVLAAPLIAFIIIEVISEKTFEYPISTNLALYIAMITMLAVLFIGLMLIDPGGIVCARDEVINLIKKLKGPSDDGKESSNESSCSNEAPSHEDKKE